MRTPKNNRKCDRWKISEWKVLLRVPERENIPCLMHDTCEIISHIVFASQQFMHQTKHHVGIFTSISCDVKGNGDIKFHLVCLHT